MATALTAALLALGLLFSTSNASPIHPRQAPAAAIAAITGDEWAALNSSVGGRLHQGVPFARPCFLSVGPGVGGAYDLGACAAVQNGYKDDAVIANNYGAWQNSNWGTCQTSAGDECLLDFNAPQNPLAYATKTCKQGSVSPFYIDVAQYQDVQAALVFVKQHGIPLSIKNSGHDYKGRSSAPNSLALWTHNLQGITRDQAFVPEGCSAGTTYDGVTYLAGQGFLSIYEFAEANSITILGGSSETVGASGGWITGAGHGALSNTLGLGVDRALQFKVVTPAGEYLTANACQNSDLFFALRGGGGGTFGVIMETTTTAAPKLTLQVAYVRFLSADLNSARAFMALLIAQAEKWATEGWGGYIQPGAITSQSSGFVLMTPKLSNADAKASMQPIFDYVNSLPNLPLNAEVNEEPSFLTAYNKYLVPNEELVGLEVAVASRLIPTPNFAADRQQELLDAFMNGFRTVGSNVLQTGGLIYGGAPTQILVTTPYNYANPPPSAVTPAWRDAIWHVLYAPTFNTGTSPRDIAAIFRKASTSAQFLRDITPGSGAYQNEADILEPDHTASFWGAENYARLLQLKQQYDPENIFTVWHGIGFDENDAKYACYPGR